MKNKLIYLCLLLNFAFFTSSVAQITDNEEVQVTKAFLLGKTAPIRDLAPAPASSLEKIKKAKQNRPHEVPNFFGRESGDIATNHNALPTGTDPIRQSNIYRDEDGLVVVPKVNIEGISGFDSNSTPPDPTGDIGNQYYVQMVNATLFQIFDKEGNEVTGPTTVNTLWAPFGEQSAGDPIILFDHDANRWLMTEFAPMGQNKLLVAISETEDPTGSWLAYKFSTPNFPDYPKYGVWNNSYYVTTNEFTNQSSIYFIDRAGMLAGEEEVDMQRLTIPHGNGPGFFVPTPVDWDGDLAPPEDTPPMVLRIADDSWNPGVDRIQMWTFNVDWDNPNNSSSSSVINIITQPFDSNPCSTSAGGGFACLPQPNPSLGIDGIPRVIMQRIPYRNFGTHESLVMSFIVDATAGSNVAGIRWVEMRKMPGGDWSVYQEGTYAPEDGNHRFMPGIAIDGLGNIGLAYAVSGTETFPSIRYTGRRVNDPLGEMTVEEYECSPGEGNSVVARYGDYASMSVDPVNNRTFWYTGQFMGTGGSWKTGIIAFEVQRDSVDVGMLSLNSPQSALDLTDTETVKVEIKNYGRDTQMVFNVGYVFEEEAPVIEAVTTVLAPDSVYVHTFSTTVDMQDIKTYDFKLFVTLDGDQAIFNDTLRKVVANLPRYDAAITDILGAEGIVVCSDNIDEVSLKLQNIGEVTLTSVEIHWQLNSDTEQIINWTGELETGEAEDISISIPNLQNGSNTLTAFTLNPNGENDETANNDQFSRPIQAFPGGVSIFFRLRTDDHPAETSWEVTDGGGTVIYAGGNYVLTRHNYYEEWCLDPEGCYTFTIYDNFGDGMSDPIGFGLMTIEDAYEHELASLMEFNFGTSEVHAFCATAECLVEGTASVSPESVEGAMDGTIMVNGENVGTGAQYSINGGSTFQDSPLFTGLSAGTYQIVINDGGDCEFNIPDVVVDIMTGTEWLTSGVDIEIFPNPTEGVFKININGVPDMNNLGFSIRNAAGKIIQHHNLVRYNETLTGEFSLIAYPAGLYFIILKDKSIQKVLKLVKK